MPLKERSSASAAAISDSAGSPDKVPNSRYSSGPSQRVARVFCSTARHGTSENAAPHAAAAAARTRASPCRMKRIAGGNGLIHSAAGTGGKRRAAASVIDACSGGIVEDRRGHQDLELAALHGHEQGLPETGPAAFDQPQGNRMAQYAAR